VLSDPRTLTAVTTAVVIVVVVTFVELDESDAGVGSWWIAAGVLVCAFGLVVWFVRRARP
jgi:hypothetical protein